MIKQESIYLNPIDDGVALYYGVKKYMKNSKKEGNIQVLVVKNLWIGTNMQRNLKLFPIPTVKHHHKIQIKNEQEIDPLKL